MARFVLVALGIALLLAARHAPAEEDTLLPCDVEVMAEMLVDPDPLVRALAAHGLRRVTATERQDMLEAVRRAVIEDAAREWKGTRDEPLPAEDTTAGAYITIREIVVEPGVLPPDEVVLLGKEDVERLLAEIETRGRVFLRVEDALYERQLLWSGSPNKTAYVDTHRVEMTRDGEHVRPVIYEIEHGDLLTVCPTVVGADNAVTVDLAAYWPDLDEPMLSIPVPAGDEAARIHLPMLHCYRAHAVETVPDDCYLLVRAKHVFGRERRGTETALLVHVKAGDFARPWGDPEPIPQEIELVPPEEADGPPPSLNPGFTPR
ncbi:MAG: hypothetical protein ACYTG6_00770 [Planctomycetota bacterium]|jgi:hypothetical protein